MAPEPSGAGTNLDLDGPVLQEFTRTRQDLERWRAGDRRAFDDLWCRYHPALELLVAGKIRKTVEPALRAHLDRDDVLQDVAVAVFSNLADFQYRGPGSVMAWMSTIAERTILGWLDYWRAGKRHPRVEWPSSWTATTGAGERSLFADPAAGPVTDSSTREHRQKLALAMATLSDREHTILLWRFFGGAEWNEIAAQLGASSGEAVRKECYLKIFPSVATALASG